MGIALLTLSALTHPLLALQRWWIAGHSPAQHRRAHGVAKPLQTDCAHPSQRHSDRTRIAVDGGFGISPTLPMAGGKPAPCKQMAHLPRASASIAYSPFKQPRLPALRKHHSACGRMALAGRMADVCAELDRLAASEAAH